MSVPVLIRSREAPDGRLYRLRRIDELDVAALSELVAINERARKAGRNRRGVVAGLRVRAALGDALSIIVDGLEPTVLRRIDVRQRIRLCGLFIEHSRSTA